MLGSMNQLAVTLGIILAYLAGYFFYWDWLALLGCIPSALLLIMMFWMPESPRWYLEKNRKSDALKSLLWLRGSQSGIEDECRETEASLGNVIFVCARRKSEVCTGQMCLCLNEVNEISGR